MFDSTRRGLHPGLAQILAVSRTKLDTHPWESNSRLESDIYYKRGAPFLSCHSVERLSSYSNIYPSFSSLGKKKKGKYFSSETLSLLSPRNFSIRFYHRVHGSMAMAGGVARCLDWIVSKKWVTAKQGRPAAVRWEPLKEARDRWWRWRGIQLNRQWITFRTCSDQLYLAV